MNDRIAITMGDVAGVGPEIIARAWPELASFCTPVVVGDAERLSQAAALVGLQAKIASVRQPADIAPAPDVVPCLKVATPNLSDVEFGRVSAAAGRAAYDFLCRAIDLALFGSIDALVTCPLHKEGLHEAGIPYPGHTEILAGRTGASRHAMLLYCEGLAVLHVTLHMALRDALAQITPMAIRDAIELLDDLMPRLIDRPPRLAVCALNPHASDGGLFGDDEVRMILPAVERCKNAGANVVGPIPADALWPKAVNGEFDGVIAMYHDQGHIPMKMRFGRRAVNITAGLPIVRTSVAHGTAYDIAGKGIADAESLITACRVATKLAKK